MQWYIYENSTVVQMDSLNKRLKQDLIQIGIVKIWETKYVNDYVAQKSLFGLAK